MTDQSALDKHIHAKWASAGLCAGCGSPDLARPFRCKKCHKTKLEYALKERRRRRAAGICQRSGCNEPASTLCDEHKSESQAYNRKYARDEYEKKKAAGFFICRRKGCRQESEGGTRSCGKHREHDRLRSRRRRAGRCQDHRNSSARLVAEQDSPGLRHSVRAD